MKILKIAVSVLIICITILTIYANVRPLSISEKLKSVNIAFINLHQPLEASMQVVLKNIIARTPGVTACSISSEGNMASIVFYPDVVSETSLIKLISEQSNIATI
jgi:hypothetical protein